MQTPKQSHFVISNLMQGPGFPVVGKHIVAAIKHFGLLDRDREAYI